MNHYKAVNTLESLVPEINQTGDPEGVLLKYASDNDLAPAELERLGQLFNTAKTLTFMKKATDNRGGNFSIINVDGLVEKFTTYTPTKKAYVKSAASNVPSHDVYRIPDLKVILGEKENVKVASNGGENFIGEHDVREGLEEIIKQAAQLEEEADRQIMEEGLRDYIGSQTEVAWGLMNKLASHICNEPDVYTQLQLDSASREDCNAPAIANLKSWMETYESHIPLKDPDAVKMASIKITRDTTGYLPLLDQLNETIVSINTATEMIKEAASSPWGSPGTMEEEIYKDPPEPPENPKEKKPKKSDKTPEELEAEAAAKEAERVQSLEQTEGNAEIMGGLRAEQSIPSWFSDPEPEPKGKGGEKFVESVDKVVSEVGRKADTPIKWLVDKMKSTPGKDSKAMSRDKTIRELQAAVVLQKAIMTDPILSEADPSRVVSLYNSLYTADPELMADPNLAMYTLREAVQYDGVTPHTYQQLADINKTRTQTEKERAGLDDQKYRI